MKPPGDTQVPGRASGLTRWAAALALASVAVGGYLLYDKAAPAAAPGADLAAVAGGVSAADMAAPDPIGSKIFEVDAAGKLVRNEQTRVNVEALVALTPPDQLRAAALAQVQDLPTALAVEALDLIERYDGYQAAQKLSFAPGNAPQVPEEALAELDGLHALRVSYFGREGAQSLFGNEEAVARQLLEWMREDNAPGLSMEQRAMRAQARYDALQASRASQGAASGAR